MSLCKKVSGNSKLNEIAAFMHWNILIRNSNELFDIQMHSLEISVCWEYLRISLRWSFIKVKKQIKKYYIYIF